MVSAALTGLLAGVVMGAVLSRGDFCFHSLFLGAWRGEPGLLRSWAIAVGLGSVGLSLLYLLPWSHGLTTGLAFRPVGNIAGGLVVGVGMVVARTCTSGLFYRLGTGAMGMLTGLLGWALGEYAVSQVSLHGLDLRGPSVLDGGLSGTVPGVLGVPRLAAAVVFLVVAGALAWRGPSPFARARLGALLAGALLVGWVLARAGGSSYGPSTVGAVAGFAAGTPRWWLTGFLVGLVAGSALVSTATRRPRPAPSSRWRLAGLAVGGFLLGGGGWVAGGCNLGHGLSGVAQLNVSSFVAVAAMAVGVLVADRVARSVRR